MRRGLTLFKRERERNGMNFFGLCMVSEKKRERRKKKKKKKKRYCTGIPPNTNNVNVP